MRRNFYLPWQRTPRALPTAMLKPRLRGAARRGKGISASAAADLIASNAPLRTRRHKVRQVYTKPLTPGDSRGRSPLARLSPLSFVVQRKMGPSETVGLAEQSVKNEKREKASREPLTAGPFSLPFESSASAPGTSPGQTSHKSRIPYPPNKPPPPPGFSAAGDSGETYDAR